MERMSGAVSQYDFILGDFPVWSSGKTLHSQCWGAGLGLIPCQGTRFCMPHSMARKLKKRQKVLSFGCWKWDFI